MSLVWGSQPSLNFSEIEWRIPKYHRHTDGLTAKNEIFSIFNHIIYVLRKPSKKV